ncbi:MAG: hypothetical protein LR001_05430 [Clostridiales bacterium]|nr:hypothetical protein [Clostridiales bacterium]
MSGLRMIFVSDDLRVFKISQPQNSIYNPVKQLSNATVLEVGFYYETYERKPVKLLNVFFDRLQLNSNGQYLLTEDELGRRTRNFNLFAFDTPETFSKSERQIPIPSTLEFPTSREKEIIIEYMKDKLPQLYPEGCYVIEKTIQGIKEKNEKNKNFVREVAKRRALSKGRGI